MGRYQPCELIVLACKLFQLGRVSRERGFSIPGRFETLRFGLKILLWSKLHEKVFAFALNRVQNF